MYYRSEHVSVTCIIGHTCERHMYYRLEHERHMYEVRTCVMYYRLEHVSVTCIIGQNM